MFSLPLLTVLSVCFLGSVSTGCAADLRQNLSKEEGVRFRKLANGITSLIQQNSFPSRFISLRFTMGSNENALFSLDTTVDAQEDIDAFLQLCHDQCYAHSASSNSSLLMEGIKIRGFHATEDFSLSDCKAENMAVIAVGDFCESSMQAKIEEYLGGISFRHPHDQLRAPIQIGLSQFPSGVALHIDYPLPSKKQISYGDLKESWMHIFAQDLLQQRLERLTYALRENWVHPHPRFMLPVQGFALTSEEKMPNVLSVLLWEIEQIKLEGFYENEFFTLKQNMIHRLQHLERNLLESESDKMASFYADAFRLNKGHLCYEDFLDASEGIVAQMEFDDLTPYVRNLLSDQNRFIHIRYPQNYTSRPLAASEIKEMVEKISSLAEFEAESYYDDDDIMLLDDRFPRSMKRNGMIQKCSFSESSDLVKSELQNASPEAHPFFHLPLSSSDKNTISYVITNMANKNIFELAFDKKKMEEKGKKINHVHPMRFMGFIFSESELKKDMKRIKKSSFKWDALIDGFAKRMKEENSKDNLMLYVPGFAEQVNANPDKIIYYIHRKDWEGIVRYLMQI